MIHIGVAAAKRAVHCVSGKNGIDGRYRLKRYRINATLQGCKTLNGAPQ